MVSRVKEEQECCVGIENGSSDEKSRRHPRWTRQETLTLIQAKDITENGPNKGRKIFSSLSSENSEPKWVMISAYCRQQGVSRGPAQCRKRWSNLIGDYRKVKNWEAKLKDKAESFWIMRNDLRKENKLPVSFDREVFLVLAGREMGSAAAVSPLPLQAVASSASAAAAAASPAVCYDIGNADDVEEDGVDEGETAEDVEPERETGTEKEQITVNAGQSPEGSAVLLSDDMQESPAKDKTTASHFEESTVKDMTTASHFEESPVKDMTTGIHEESPVKEMTTASHLEEHPVKDMTTASHSEESPIKDMTIGSNGESPVKEKTPTRDLEESHVKDKATASNSEESPVLDKTTASHLEESPVKGQTTAKHFKESPIKDKTTVRHFEDSPMKDKTTARHFEESPVKDKTTAITLEDSPVRYQTTARHFEKSPVKDKTTAITLQDTPVRDQTTARHFEKSPAKDKRIARHSEDSYIKTLEPSSDGFKEPWPGISYWDSQEKAKRRRLSIDDSKSSKVEAQIMEVLETNNRMLNAQLDIHNKNIQLDREQRKENNDVLVAALGNLTNVLVKLAEKL